MVIPRIFVRSKLRPEQELLLDDDLSNYISQVLRLKISDRLLVFNNSGGEFTAVISAVNKKQVVIIIGEFIQCDNESPLKIYLGQGISRCEKMDFTIQKATELGLNEITPLFTQYCGIKLKDERLANRLRHWQGVAISASCQCGRCYVPEVSLASTLGNWVAKETAGLSLVLDPAATTTLNDIKEKPQEVTILVGPEGGLSDQEINFAKQNNFLSIKFGPRILRTETAALAAISVLQAKWGDF